MSRKMSGGSTSLLVTESAFQKNRRILPEVLAVLLLLLWRGIWKLFWMSFFFFTTHNLRLCEHTSSLGFWKIVE